MSSPRPVYTENVSPSLESQRETEELVQAYLNQDLQSLYIDEHIKYLTSIFMDTDESSKGILGKKYLSLESSIPWILYWILQSLDLLHYPLNNQPLIDLALTTLKNCYDKDNGGFGGGQCQEVHLLTTFAAVHSIAILGSKEAYSFICQEKILSLLENFKYKDGSFCVHENGERDLRGCYAAISIAEVTGLFSHPFYIRRTKALFKDTLQFIQSCQTYEGGFGGLPMREAHGGYTFCGLAGLSILANYYFIDVASMINIPNLIKWSQERQLPFEGGYQGRKYKLVDGCYSYWLGGTLSILQKYTPMHPPLVDYKKVRDFILNVCQRTPGGGLRDKPDKEPDYYHTCYVLAGLSLLQDQLNEEDITWTKLKQLHSYYNLDKTKAMSMMYHFSK